MSHSHHVEYDRFSSVYIVGRLWHRLGEISDFVTGAGGSKFRAEISSGASQGKHGLTLNLTKEILFDEKNAVVFLDAMERSLSETVVVAHVRLAVSAWCANLKGIHLSSDVEQLSLTINSLIDDVRKDEIKVNKELLQIDVKNASASHLVAVLSTLFSWRSTMGNWQILLERSVKELKGRNIEGVDAALNGLILR